MKHPTATLEGANLDYAAAKAFCFIEDGYFEDSIHIVNGKCNIGDELFAPSTDWSQGGGIIEREDMYIGPCSASIGSPAFVMIGGIHGYHAQHPSGARSYGKTYLIAAMRCFVASKLGEEVEIP